MSNKQYNKCPKCGQDEKYVVWDASSNPAKEIRCCAKQCMIKGKK